MWLRAISVALYVLFVGGGAALVFAEHFLQIEVESEIAIVVGAALAVTPFVSLLALMVIGFVVGKGRPNPLRDESPLFRTFIEFIGPLAILWWIFRFTREEE